MGSTSAEAGATDWRLAVEEPRRRHLRTWLWSIAGMTFVVLIIGGITRLTQSGLSMVDWQPLMGVIPPLNEAQWQETFDRYRAYPEYQQLRQGMTLAEFRFIFFWEYLHRLAARAIGVVFLIPFAIFAVRGHLTRPIALRTLALFGLGAMQGLMGWLMVASGLVDRPSVSHFRLAAHLGLAFVIFSYAVWLARELAVTAQPVRAATETRRLMRRGLAAVGALLCVQIVWGAFVAGLKAGFVFNTFPLMGGRLVPQSLLLMEPAVLNFVQNPIAVQWTHRVLGTALLVASALLWLGVLRVRVDDTSRALNTTLFGLIAGQYVLGIMTLLLHVPVALGVTHQAMAMVITGVWLVWLHHVMRMEPTGERTPRVAATATARG